MRGLIVAFCLVAATVPASAMSRLDASKMTCAEVQERIRTEGEVVLRYRSNSNASMYGRYVSGNRMCPAGTTKAYPTTVPSADNKACPVLACDYSR